VNIRFVDLCLQKWVNEIDISQRIIGTAIKNLHLRDMRVLAIPFPPIEEQKEIVRRVESLFALADKVEKQYTQAKKSVDALTQSLLAKAFRGELVPQDPNDEPAELLLKRIQDERQQQVASKPKRKIRNSAKKPQKTSTMKLNQVPENYLLDLLTQLGGEAHAEALWQKSALAIDDFYAKLKQEMHCGHIIDDNKSPDPALRKLKLIQ
jgi:type I restriction enzyme S subunit